MSSGDLGIRRKRCARHWDIVRTSISFEWTWLRVFDCRPLSTACITLIRRDQKTIIIMASSLRRRGVLARHHEDLLRSKRLGAIYIRPDTTPNPRIRESVFTPRHVSFNTSSLGSSLPVSSTIDGRAWSGTCLGINLNFLAFSISSDHCFGFCISSSFWVFHSIRFLVV